MEYIECQSQQRLLNAFISISSFYKSRERERWKLDVFVRVCVCCVRFCMTMVSNMQTAWAHLTKQMQSIAMDFSDFCVALLITDGDERSVWAS